MTRYDQTAVRERQEASLQYSLSFESNGDSIEIIQFQEAHIKLAERDTDIGNLYSRWLAAAGINKIPYASQFKPSGYNIGRFYVGNGSPLDYYYTSTDSNLQMFAVRLITPDLLRKQMIKDLIYARNEGKVAYQQVTHCMKNDTEVGEVFHAGATPFVRFFPKECELIFRRILLPVINGDGEIEIVYSTVRHMGIDRAELLADEMSAS